MPFTERSLFAVRDALRSNIANNSVSTPCNFVDDMSLVAWAYYDAGSGNYYIDYKTTFYSGTGTGYNYRGANPTHTQAITGLQASVSVFPNPASDRITISNPVGNAADRYSITDVSGKTVLTGRLATGNQDVAIQSLANGSYIISLYRAGAEYGQRIFVKNQ